MFQILQWIFLPLLQIRFSPNYAKISNENEIFHPNPQYMKGLREQNSDWC